MELDELRQHWAAQDRRLDEVLRLNRRLLLTTNLDKTRSAMQRVRATLALELVIDVIALVALSAFIAARLTEPRFVAPAALLHLVALGQAVSTIRQLVMAAEINYDDPVTVIQRSLETLRVARIRTTQWLLLLAPLLWTPLLIVGLRAGLGVDAYALLGAKYLLANLLFGVAFAAAVVWACRRFADRLDRSTWMRRLARDVAGTSLSSAMDQLERITAFEREER